MSFDFTDLTGTSSDRDTVFLQQQFCDGSRGDPCRRFPAGRTAAAPVIPDAVLLKEGEISMAGTENFCNVGIIFGMLIGIPQKDCNGCSCGNTLKNARQDLAGVTFFSGGADRRLPRLAAVKFMLDEAAVNGDPGRHTVHDDAQSSTVGFAESRYGESRTERIVHRMFFPVFFLFRAWFP